MTAERRWTTDDLGAVATGAVLVGTAFLPWYEATVPPDRTLGLRGWDLGAVALVAVLLSGYAAARVVWLKFRPLKPEVPLAPGAEPFAASIVALLLVSYRALDVPTVPLSSGTFRTVWLSVVCVAVLLQVVFTGRTVARTGLRAS